MPPKMTKEILMKNAELIRIGGPGTMRRKKKLVHKTSSADDQKLQGAMKKLGVTPIGDIDEVNLIMNTGSVVHFSHPKVQASIPNNTYVVSGHSETRQLQDMLPSIMGQLGAENVDQLRQIAESMGAAKDAMPTDSFE
eukprot:NODE_8572_length_694_cov_64.024518_g8315_i0.p1 GENE.NODE_8572_length_694_cov_64.024518_g8315_i0~~NODE_8572_length_694_cov_64.024518_g8315_i0.p1  ORF type:complete len:138 (+),score=42.91 NODE_8572_length_694_cov_64.024518_g8315_i0:84-497(+)